MRVEWTTGARTTLFRTATLAAASGMAVEAPAVRRPRRACEDTPRRG